MSIIGKTIIIACPHPVNLNAKFYPLYNVWYVILYHSAKCEAVFQLWPVTKHRADRNRLYIRQRRV